MARRMVSADDRPVSFDDDFRVLVSTEQEGAEIWTRQVSAAGADGQYRKSYDVPRQQTDAEYVVPTPDLGSVTQVRLFGSLSGSPDGGGLLVDELIIPRLDKGSRRGHLSDCTEGWPQVALSTGGTWVRGLLGSSGIPTLGQVFLGRTAPVWPGGEPFPVFPGGGFLFSSASFRPGYAHDVLLVDARSDGWPTDPGLDPGTPVWFVALVWDVAGGWDFTWNSEATMPARPGPHLPAPEELQTLHRQVEFHVTELVCLDDSDDFSDGDATFTLAVRAGGVPDDVRTLRWVPMESGSAKVVDETFTVGGAAGPPVLAVAALEDDSNTPFGDDDDGAVTAPFGLSYPRGPGPESFTQDATLDAGPGGSGLRFQVHCAATVSYL